MLTITTSQIANDTPDALAAIEELEMTGRLTDTADSQIAVTDDYGAPLTAEQAAAEIRKALAA